MASREVVCVAIELDLSLWFGLGGSLVLCQASEEEEEEEEFSL